MSYPEKEKRNKELYEKRIKNPEHWSFGALASYYNLTKPTAHKIFHREAKRKAS